MQGPGENLQPQPDQITNIKSQARQLQEKIRTKEAELGGPISYSVGKGDSEVVILTQPLHQEVEAVWNGDKTRLVQRERYLAVGSFGIGAIDFVKAGRFDSSDDIPDSESGGTLGLPVKGITYAPEGQWITVPGSNEDTGRSEKGFLRNVTSLNGVDKLTPANGVNANVDIVMHDRDGFGIMPDGSPMLSIGVDFRAPISQDATVEEFSQAVQKSIESVKPVELHTDTTKQASLLTAAMSSF